jgi:hypothetical protein
MTRSRQSRLGAALWTAQISLAIVFALSGILKAWVPAVDLEGRLSFMVEAQAGVLGPVGLVEIVLALGLILPAGARVLPGLTPFSAVGLGATTLLGLVQPTSAGGLGLVFPSLALLAGSAFVAWGRLFAAPIEGDRFGPEPEIEDPVEAARLERNRQRHAAKIGQARGAA